MRNFVLGVIFTLLVLVLAGSDDEAVGGHGHREIHLVAGLRAHAALLSVVAIR